MAKKKRETILFSCLGSSDPVRGEHDGAMLHIVRHYRPDRILWYLTSEMRAANEKDHRFELAMDYLFRQYPDYHPEILPPCYGEVEDASDFDGFYDVFQQLLSDLSDRYPEAEILVNISSGTPQMKMTLALLAVSLRFRIRVIQVKNFERRSGTATRTTEKTYDLEYELELNEDNEPDAPNRCSEPRLTVVQRDRQRSQIDSLLRRYDYEALQSMSRILPESLQTLIRHLAFRASYNTNAARQEAKNCRGIELYPAGEKNAPTYRAYSDLAEYILILKLMQRTQRYTDLVIRLNPLVIRLQMAWLESRGVDFSRLGPVNRGRQIIDPAVIRRNDPSLESWLQQRYASYGGFRSAPVNILFCNYLVDWIGEAGSEGGLLFSRLAALNNERNESAHSLSNVTEDDIQRIMGYGSGELIRKLTGLLEEVYPAHYDPALFSVYDTANERIREAL